MSDKSLERHGGKISENFNQLRYFGWFGFYWKKTQNHSSNWQTIFGKSNWISSTNQRTCWNIISKIFLIIVILKELAKNLVTVLEQKFLKSLLPVHYAATIFDSRYRGFKFINDEIKRDEAKKVATKFIDWKIQKNAKFETKEIHLPKKIKIEKFGEDSLDEEVYETTDEIKLYLEQKITKSKNALECLRVKLIKFIDLF